MYQVIKTVASDCVLRGHEIILIFIMSGNWYYTGTWNRSQSRFILQSMPWMLMIWQCKEPRHQQQCVEMQVVLEYSNLSTRNSLIQWGQDKMVAILASNIFRCIFLNENIQILTKISQNFVPKGPINNIPALIQITASWHTPVDKPLMVSLQMYICIIRPQWIMIHWLKDLP